MIRLLVISPNQMVNTLLTQVLDQESDINVVGAITDLEKARKFAGHIDIIGIHVDAADGDPFRAIRDLRAGLPDARIVVLHTPELRELILNYIEAGAAGYVREDQSVAQMVQVIRTVHSHGAAIDPSFTGMLVQRVAELHSEINKRARLDMTFNVELTEREWEVLECLAEGCTNSEIGERLFISTGTVKNHVHSILGKLDVKDRSQAAYWFAWRRQYQGGGNEGPEGDSDPVAPDGHRASLLAASGVPEIREAIAGELSGFCRQLGWQIGHIFLLDELRNELLPAGIWHPEEPGPFAAFRAATESTRVVATDNTVGQVLLSTEPTWVVDVRRHPGFSRSDAARAVGVRSGLFLPLLHQGVIGVLEFYATDRDEPDPEIVAGIIRSGQEVGQLLEDALQPDAEPSEA